MSEQQGNSQTHLAKIDTKPQEKGFFQSRFWLRMGGYWESLGRWLPTRIAGGVLMVEVTKRVAAPTRPGAPATKRRPMRVLEGLTGPDPKPARST